MHESPPTTSSRPAAARRRRTAAGLGFGLGIAGATLAAFLLLGRAGEDTPAAPPESTAPHSAAVPAHDRSDHLSEEEAGLLSDLRRRVSDSPDDLVARKQLAVKLLENGLPVEAFEQASQILASAPQDPDGLYVHGEVRLAMGQPIEALRALDQVVVLYPDHLRALVARGKAQRRIGDLAGAALSLERALAVAGGSHPEIESLLGELGEWPTAEAEAVIESGLPTPAPFSSGQ